MPIAGDSRKYETQYGFRCEIDGVQFAGFRTCSEIGIKKEKISIREGGGLYPKIQTGLAEHPDLTLERGAVASDRDLFDWMQDGANSATDLGVGDRAQARTMDIVVVDDAQVVQKRWRLVVVPIEFMSGGWDQDASEITVDKLVLAVERCVLISG